MVRPIGIGWYQDRVRMITGSTCAKGWLKRYVAAVTGLGLPRFAGQIR